MLAACQRYGWQTARRHQDRGGLVWVRARSTTGARDGYGSSSSSSSASSDTCTFSPSSSSSSSPSSSGGSPRCSYRSGSWTPVMAVPSTAWTLKKKKRHQQTGAGCITILVHGPVTCLYYSQSQRQTVKPLILYTRPLALVQSYLNPSFFSESDLSKELASHRCRKCKSE